MNAVHRPISTHSLIGVLLVLVLAWPAAAAAQPSARQQAADLSSQLMSPFCPGRRLVDCTSSQAYDLREAIAARLTAGESVEAVRADLVRQYGHEILGAPPAEGVGLLAWWLPALLGVATSGAVAWKVANAARASSSLAALAAAPTGDARLLAQLDDELRDLD
jgi:cytochrome c-type biogenesis protein CcmH/NrfF